MAKGQAPGKPEFIDGRHEKAVEAFDQVLALNPNHYGAWFYKAFTLYKISHSLSAMRNLVARAASQGQTIVPSTKAIGRLALDCVEKAIAFQPDRPEPQKLREDILAWINEGA